MNILIIIATLFLLITKYFDVITTYKGIKKNGNIEKYIIGRVLFNKFGLIKGLIIVSLIYIAIVFLALYEAYNGNNSIKIAYLILSFIIGIIQILVALNNKKLGGRI